MDISIVISLYNEDESIPELVKWIGDALSSSTVSNKEYEIIFINDGSTDKSWQIIQTLSESDNRIRAISFRKNYGKSAALYCGFKAAKGDVVITMDADLQDDPTEIAELYRMIMEDDYDLVSGWKKKRYDNFFAKNIPSKIYNSTARLITGLKLHDMNCGLKAYKNEVVKNIEVYGDMHRYIPYIAKNAGFSNIGEKVVLHQKRKYGKSKFGISRFFNGFLDLLSIYFLSKFRNRPMHIFGFLGIFAFMTGIIISIFLIIEKLISQHKALPFRQVTEQPLFYIALVTLIIGTQLFLTGFLAELMSRSSTTRNNYKINKTIR